MERMSLIVLTKRYIKGMPALEQDEKAAVIVLRHVAGVGLVYWSV